MSESYYMRRRGQPVGPFDLITLQRLYKKGALNPTTEVSSDGEKWIKAGELIKTFPVEVDNPPSPPPPGPPASETPSAARSDVQAIPEKNPAGSQEDRITPILEPGPPPIETFVDRATRLPRQTHFIALALIAVVFLLFFANYMSKKNQRRPPEVAARQRPDEADEAKRRQQELDREKKKKEVAAKEAVAKKAAQEAAEQEAKDKAAAEADRKKRDEEAAIRAAEEEARKKRAEEAARKKKAEEAAARAAKEKARKEQEALARQRGSRLLPIPDKQLDEETMLRVKAAVTDKKLFGKKLTYRLLRPPPGCRIDSASGEIVWTPNERQGPGEYDLTVEALFAEDAKLNNRKVFQLTVREVNRPPQVSPVSSQQVELGQSVSLQLQATDPDLPKNSVKLKLVRGPAGARFDPASGRFVWEKVDKSESVTVLVSDNGKPPLESRFTFRIHPFQANSVGMNMILIRAGQFQMGSPNGEVDERPQHTVQLIKSFYLSAHEVTQQQYQKVMGNNPSNFKGLNRPVEQVSWRDARTFCEKLSKRKKEKHKYRLPTEAEWEYACRAGGNTKYCFGNVQLQLAHYAWYADNSKSTTQLVGKKKPNAWGLYDMHGNVSEWCLDWYIADFYNDGPRGVFAGRPRVSRDPRGPPDYSNTEHVLRGGSWGVGPNLLRSAYRHRDKETSGHNRYGFRVLQQVKLPPPPVALNNLSRLPAPQSNFP